MNSTVAFSPAYLETNRSYIVNDISFIFAIWVTFFIVLFFVARILQKTASGADMWLMGSGYVMYIGFLVLAYLATEIGGSGKHIIAVLLEDPHRITVWLKVTVAFMYITLVTITLPRLAMLCFYLKFIKDPLYRRITYGIGLFAILYALAFMFWLSFGCRPFSRWWNNAGIVQCGNVAAAIRASTVPSVVIDLVMLLLPLSTIWKLQTSKAQKFGLILTFAAGSVGTVFAFTKLAYFFTVNLASDPTWLSVTWMTWNIVESGMYLIAATIPSLRSLPRNIRQSHAYRIVRSYTARVVRRPYRTATESSGKQGKADDSQVVDRRGNRAPIEDELPTGSSTYSHFSESQVDTDQPISMAQKLQEPDIVEILLEKGCLPYESWTDNGQITPRKEMECV